jgi:hypothetical protein
MVLAAVCLAVTASSNAMAQEPSTSWAVPEGARVTVDRQSGSISIVVPREISNRVGRDARFGGAEPPPERARSRRRAWRIPRCQHIAMLSAGLAVLRETAGHSLG